MTRDRLLGTAVVRTALSAWSWSVLAVLLVAWLPAVALVRLVTAPFDPGCYAAGRLFRRVTVVHQRLNPLWTFRRFGTLPSDPRRPYVVVANHQSFVDILLISHLPWEMKWLSKSEFFRIPLLGWLMRLSGDVPLVRDNAKSIVTAMKECEKRLDQRVSVMIFPEGTRSSGGELGEFKDGAFKLAVTAQVPILPLVVHGTGTALRKHDWRLGVSRAGVHVLDPVETAGLTRADVPRLREEVRDVIASKLAQLRTPAAGVAPAPGGRPSPVTD